MNRALLTLVLAWSSWSCGSSDGAGPAPATIDGMFDGRSLTVKSAIAGLYTGPAIGVSVPSIVVYLSSVPDVCSLVNPLNQYPQIANSRALTLEVCTAPFDAPGTFTNAIGNPAAGLDVM